jgi:septal ring factor EnvC (AmiA/AmiB activator)
MKTVRILIIAVLAILAAPPLFAQDQEEDLKRIQATEKKERLILKELEDLERQVGQLEDRLVQLETGMVNAQKRLDRNDREIRTIEKEISSLKKYLAARLRALYRLRDGGMLQVLLESESLAEMLDRYRYLSLILKRDRRAIAEYGQRTDQLQARRNQVKAEQARLYDLRVDVSREKDELESTRRKKTLLLMEVHQKKELYLRLIKSREESRQRLIKEVIIEPRAKKESPETKTKKWPNFPKLKGKIPRPAPGKITGRFGRQPGPFDTQIIRHGLIFSVTPDQAVKAVLDGEVMYVGWMKGYGNIIILDHGQRYYTLTGGLAGIRQKPGDWTQQGETLGFAPKGGQTDKKEIYFEIRHRGQALDPVPWLGSMPVT